MELLLTVAKRFEIRSTLSLPPMCAWPLIQCSSTLRREESVLYAAETEEVRAMLVLGLVAVEARIAS